MNSRAAIPFRRRIAWTVLAVVLAWGLAEAAALAYWWLVPKDQTSHLQFLYQAHPYRAFAPVPNTIDTDGKRSFNSAGLRGPEISVKKPPGTVRIVCLGASTTYSNGATTDSHTWPARMQRLLSDHYRNTGFRIEVLNAGVPASVSLESLIYFQTRLLDFSPDIAVLHQGANDVWMFYMVPGFQSDYSHARHTFAMPGRKAWEYSPLLSYLFARRSFANPYFPLGNVNLNLFILTRPEVIWDDSHRYHGPLRPEMVATFRRNIRTWIAVARGWGILPVLSTQAVQDDSATGGRWTRANEALAGVIREVAAEESTAFIDCARQMPWNPHDFYDPVHLRDTPGGLARKAAIFAQALIGQRAVDRVIETRRHKDTEG